MDACDGAREDMALLLAIKDAEINTLRQQMAQLADDLKRNLAVLSVKDEEAMKLRSTVDALRSVLAEKDNLFSQFQVQVQELEALRLKETEQRAALEQLLAAKQLERKQQQDVQQQGRDAELAAFQQQLKDTEDSWAAQLMQARQAALDDSIHRSTQQQAALERVAENGERLQQQVDCLTSALGVKESELEAAHRQLGAALDTTQKLEATHAKTLAAKDNLIQQLQQQLEQQNAGIGHTTREHETNMNKLITSLQQMQESCQAQALEVQEYAAGQKKLHDERRVLRDQLRQQEVTITKLQTEKGVLEAALQHEVTAQATAQAQLNIFQAKLTEAVVELEKRCAAAETRSSKLMAQLVDERGRLVDAVIEQANSSTPQLAAELARSLESDRLRTQAELHMAQERSRSLQEDLSLIRSTLLPLLQAPAAAAAAAAGAGPPVQAGNGCMAALAQVIMQKERQQQPTQQQQRQETFTADADAAGPLMDSSDAVNAEYSLYAPDGKLQAAAASPGGQQYHSLARSGNNAISSCMTTEYAVYGSSPATVTVQQPIGAAVMDRTPQRGGGGGGSLAGLVHELQSDVGKLQAQLQHSRRQLKWDVQQQANGGNKCSRAREDEAVDSRPGSSGGQHHCSCSSDSPARQQQQQHSSSVALANSQHTTPQRHSSSVPASPCSPDLQLHDALRYLLERTEQLSAENGALKTQLVQGSPAAKASPHHHSPHLQPVPGRHNSSSPYHTRNSTEPHQHELAGVNHHFRRTPATKSAAAGADDRSDAGHGTYCEGGECDDDSSSMAGSMHGPRNVRDGLSSAAREELASAGAVAAVECSRRRRQARAAAAAAAAGADAMQRSGTGHQPDSPSRYSRRQSGMLQRSSSLDSGDTSSSIVVSELSSYDTLSAIVAAAGGGRSSSDARLLARMQQARGSSSKQVLQSVLAHWPANNKVGKLMKELIAAAGNGDVRGAGQLHAVNHHTSSIRGAAAASKAALARAQLGRLAELSPTRQRLLRALAGSDL